MLKILREPFPYHESKRRYIINLFGVGIFVSLFLIIFQPFNLIAFQSPYKTLYLVGYGVLTIAVFLLLNLFRPLFPSFFNERDWTLGRHFFWLWINLSILFVICFIYTVYIFEGQFYWLGLVLFYGNAMAVAIFPTVFLTLLDYVRKIKAHQNISTSINESISKKINPAIDKQELMLFDENEKEQFSCDLSALFYVQAASNYVEIIYEKEAQIKKHILRNTLKNIEQQIAQEGLFRCHRSYLVHLKKVAKITGNAQGYQLHFSNALVPQIPVARSKGKAILALVEQ